MLRVQVEKCELENTNLQPVAVSGGWMPGRDLSLMHCPLIGQDTSRDLSTVLWLASSRIPGQARSGLGQECPGLGCALRTFLEHIDQPTQLGWPGPLHSVQGADYAKRRLMRMMAPGPSQARSRSWGKWSSSSELGLSGPGPCVGAQAQARLGDIRIGVDKSRECPYEGIVQT